MYKNVHRNDRNVEEIVGEMIEENHSEPSCMSASSCTSAYLHLTFFGCI